MKQTSVWTVLGLLMGVLLITLPSSSFAKDWTSMKAGRFPATIDSAFSQCMYHAQASKAAVLKPFHCTEFKLSLESGKCALGQIPDGVWYDRMASTDSQGQTVSIGNSRKRLGSSTPAYECYLSDGVVLHWYTTTSASCNNVAVVGVAPKPKPKPKPQQCFWVSDGATYHQGLVVGTPGVHIHDEFCGHDINIPGSTTVIPGQTTTGARLVCR